jgi:hypothetical protein
MNQWTDFLMRLDLGVAAEDMSQAEVLLGRALDLRFDHADDQELGGDYYMYQPTVLPAKGIADARLRRNERDPADFVFPRMRDVPFIAEVSLIGDDPLELARVHQAIMAVGSGTFRLYSYNVVPFERSNAGGPGWRAHSVPAGPDAPETPSLLCHSTFALAFGRIEEAAAWARTHFGAPLRRREDEWLGGSYFESVPAAGRPGILVRPNELDLEIWLYPQWKHISVLLDVQLETPSLLTFGALVHNLETRAGATAQLIGWRVSGDLINDRTPRFLACEYQDREDAASTWRAGHTRGPDELDDDDDDDDEELSS